MEHWFDDLTRKIGIQPLSRRRMVRVTARLGAMAAGTSLLGRGATAASAAQVPAAASAVSVLQAGDRGQGHAGLQIAPAVSAAVGVLQAGASTLQVDDSDGVLMTSFSVSSAGESLPLTLSHSFSAEVATGNVSSTLTVKSGNEIIRKLSTMALAGGVGAATISQGARYTGSKSSFFRTDGTTVQDAADDRLIEPAPLAAEVSTLRFKDGKPDRPEIQTAPDLDRVVTELLRQSQAQLVRCQPDGKAPQAISTCTQRQFNCREGWVQCSLAAAHSSLACGPLASVCYLKVVNATCDRAIQQCFTVAKSSGACCPAYCKGDATCCQTSWGCCPSSSQIKIDGQAASKAWPTCPRCGPLTAPVTATPEPVSGSGQAQVAITGAASHAILERMPKKPVHRSISFRPAEPADRPFLLQVYGSTRADELAMTGWDDAQKQAFIEMQFRAQDLDYHRNYPDASFQVINVDGQAAGRLYVRRSLDTIWIIDIALLPEHRGQGLGTRMLRELQEEARAAGKPLWIHVERFNPALKLYVRLGFTLIEDQGVYLLLEWSPDGASSAPAAQPSTRQNSGA